MRGYTTRLRADDVPVDTLQNRVDGALVCPLLTAYPTEVQRKSTLDAERENRAPARLAPSHAADARRAGRCGACIAHADAFFHRGPA